MGAKPTISRQPIENWNSHLSQPVNAKKHVTQIKTLTQERQPTPAD